MPGNRPPGSWGNGKSIEKKWIWVIQLHTWVFVNWNFYTYKNVDTLSPQYSHNMKTTAAEHYHKKIGLDFYGYLSRVGCLIWRQNFYAFGRHIIYPWIQVPKKLIVLFLWVGSIWSGKTLYSLGWASFSPKGCGVKLHKPNDGTLFNKQLQLLIIQFFSTNIRSYLPMNIFFVER